jgi:hypothetical protein
MTMVHRFLELFTEAIFSKYSTASYPITHLKVSYDSNFHESMTNMNLAIRNYYFSFVHTMDPNNGSSYMNWPEWKESKQLMNFYATGAVLINDDFRTDSYEWIQENVDSLHI